MVAPMAASAGETLHPVTFDDLPGWTEDDHAAALTSFRRSCAEIRDAGRAFQRDIRFGSELDALACLASSAERLRLTRPAFTADDVVEIAGGVSHRAYQGRDDPATVQQRIDLLAKYALDVADPKTRGRACEAICGLVNWATWRSRPAPVALPPSVRDEYASLWPRIESGLDPDRRRFHFLEYASLLPLRLQQDEVREALAKQETQRAAALVRIATIGQSEKLRWYEQILDQARRAPNLSQRSAMLSGIARCLWDMDPDLSLRVFWEGLKIAEEEGFKPQHHDVSDWLGDPNPYVTPEECLRYNNSYMPNEPQKAIQALWAFARAEQRPSHRDGVLESLAEMLLRQEDAPQAACVAAILSDPARRAKVWTAVAIVARGKPLREDW